MLVTGFEPGDLDKDFFTVNPLLKLPFKDHIANWGTTTAPVKKSKKSASITEIQLTDTPSLSDVMWAVALMEDYDSVYFNFSRPDRLEQCLEMTGLPKGYELPKVLSDLYNELQMDSEKRYLETWNRKVDEMDRLIKDTEMTLENMEDLSKMMAQFDKLLTQKDKIIDRINKKKKDNVRGNKELGMLESNMLDI